MEDSPYSTALENMYPGVHVHSGFLQQLQAVTDKAPNRTQNIGDVLNDMAGGVPPSLIIVTGERLFMSPVACDTLEHGASRTTEPQHVRVWTHHSSVMCPAIWLASITRESLVKS